MWFWTLAACLDILFLWLAFDAAVGAGGGLGTLLIMMGPLINTGAIALLWLFIYFYRSPKGDKASRIMFGILSCVALLVIIACHAFTFLFVGS